MASDQAVGDVIASAHEPATALVVSGVLVPAVVFAEGGVDAVLAQIKAEVAKTSIDISTPGGRKECASLAYKIARSKTALDDMGKSLGEEWRKRVEAINADRRRIRTELDDLGEQVRKPLTDWENADKARIAAHEARLQHITEMAKFGSDEPPLKAIEARIDDLRAPDTIDWQEFSKRAEDAKAATIGRLMQMRERLVKLYAEREEAERLRVEAVNAYDRLISVNVALVEALKGLLCHAGIADAAPEDKDAEDHALERAARAALKLAEELGNG